MCEEDGLERLTDFECQLIQDRYLVELPGNTPSFREIAVKHNLSYNKVYRTIQAAMDKHRDDPQTTQEIEQD